LFLFAKAVEDILFQPQAYAADGKITLTQEQAVQALQNA
jgi:hypothetical protein